MSEVYTNERYHRQLILKGFGESGQQKLSQARVLVIGAGGLGCPALHYLAAAGVGTIGIVDDDVVALNNLHRQPLYTTGDIGKPKTERAAVALQKLNPGIQVIPFNVRLTASNALEIIRDFDYIIDGTDNFSSRYMINDACVLLGKPLVFGAVSQYEGQLAIFNCKGNGQEEAVNYRDLFPDPPAPGAVLNCAEAGVLGVLPGIIGTMQASETIKLITSIGRPLVNKLYTYNALDSQTYELLLSKRKDSASLIPASEEAFRQTDYEWLCGYGGNYSEIGMEEFDAMLAKGGALAVDVREFGEEPIVSEFKHIRIPLSQLPEKFGRTSAKAVLFFCQSGIRSAQAARMMSEVFGKEKMVYSLKAGIMNYKKQRQQS